MVHQRQAQYTAGFRHASGDRHVLLAFPAIPARVVVPDEDGRRVCAPGARERPPEDLLWVENPDECCFVNKIQPLAPLKATHKVWISGLMAFQTPYRAELDVFTVTNEIVKFNPLIDMSEMLYLVYTAHYHLPIHPLQVLGYGSVGCTHCTQKGEGRDGRWFGTNKTECGLHL